MKRYYIDTVEFSGLLRGRRIMDRNIGLRQAAKEIGVSAATLSRCENKSIPDTETFLLVCTWLAVQPNSFIKFGKIKK